MALTFTEHDSGVAGDRRYWEGTITFDSSYPTGGEAITPGNFGFSLEVLHLAPTSAGLVRFRVLWIKSTSKLMVVVEDGTSGIEAQAANASDLSTLTVHVVATGR